MRVRSLSYGLLLLPLLAGVGQAQRRGSMDIGSSQVTYADSIRVAALALSPAFQLGDAARTLGGSGTFSQSSGASTYSGNLHGSLVVGSAGPASVELGAAGGGSAHSDGARTAQMLGSGRLYFGGSPAGAWGGLGLGRTWDGTLWRALLQGSAGAWLSSSLGSAVLSLAPTSVDDTIRYSDVSLVLARSVGLLDVSANFGSRLGDPVPSLVTDRLWGNVSAVAWVRNRVAVVASAGTYPVDFTQGFPGGKYLSLALRLSTPRHAVSVPATQQAGRAAEANGARVLGFEVEPSGAVRRIRVWAPAARTVDITGDFTNWSPVALAPEGNGWWSLSRGIAPGMYEFNVRVNGGQWDVPPGLAVIRDEFGGTSAILVIR